MQYWKRTWVAAAIAVVPLTSAAADKLEEGTVDAFTTDESVLRAIVRQDGRPDEYVFLPDFTKSREVGIALKKDEPASKQ
jgi:ABC-type amino acid transport substrate-binding protein